MKGYENLTVAVAQLRKSERGRRALENLSNFFSEGGTGLDAENQRAAAALFLAALQTPWDLPAELTNGQFLKQRVGKALAAEGLIGKERGS